MKIAVLSDAHGNEIYFDKCMQHLKKVNPHKIVFLGDCFGYMRHGDAIMTKLRQANAKILLGNHEALLLGMLPFDAEKELVYGIENDRKNISKYNLEYIKSLQPEFHEQIDDKRILYVHGRPNSPLDGYLYENNTAFEWEEAGYDVIFMGHTHRPYIKKVNHAVYVNVGSCGLPRDIGTAPSYAVYNSCSGEVQIQRIKISAAELQQVFKQQIHSKVYECLMREGK